MNMKNLPLLAVVLVVVIGIIVVVNMLGNRRPSEQSLEWIPGFSEANCGMISVSDPHDSVFLVRKGGEWVVSDHEPSDLSAPSFLSRDSSGKVSKTLEYPADSASIQTALDKLKSLHKEELISRNPKKQAELEVDSLHGTRVSVYDTKLSPLATFYIGKSGADWSSNFIRMKGANKVYLAGGSIKYSFFADKTRWKDKSIVKFDRSFVKGIEIDKRDSASILLTRSAPSPKDSAARPSWNIVSPVKDTAKNTVVDKILNTLSNFAAADFENDTSLSADSLGFAKPYLRVTVSFENGDRKTVLVGNEKGTQGKRWVRTPDKQVTFLVYKYNIDNIDQSVNALRGIAEKKPVPAPAKAAPAHSKHRKNPVSARTGK